MVKGIEANGIMRVLVLGGSGFLGSHVIDVLCEAAHEVISLDRHPEQFRVTPVGVQFLHADFGNRGQLAAVLASGVDFVFHLISSTIPKTSNEAPIFDVQSNLIESIALFEMCIKYHVRKVVFISSGGTVYGVPKTNPVSENHPTLPLCSYGVTKLAIEHYLHLFNVLHGLKYVVLRVSNLYGVRQNPLKEQGVAAVFMYKILKDEGIDIWGDGSVVRDFVCASDVAQACLAALNSEYVGVLNVGSGTGVSIKQLVAVLEDVIEKKAKINWLKAREFDVPEVVLDCMRIAETLSWEPTVSLYDGLVEMKCWMNALVQSNKL